MTGNQQATTNTGVVDCASLATQGLWTLDKCCKDCHSGEQCMCPGMDTYTWTEHQNATLCCSAYWHFYGLRHDPHDRTCSTYLFDLQTQEAQEKGEI